jgi:hypothetical protein
VRSADCANPASLSLCRWAMWQRPAAITSRPCCRSSWPCRRTLTGSIGVLGGKLVVDGLLERIGVNTGAVQQGARAPDVLVTTRLQ